MPESKRCQLYRPVTFRFRFDSGILWHIYMDVASPDPPFSWEYGREERVLYIRAYDTHTLPIVTVPSAKEDLQERLVLPDAVCRGRKWRFIWNWLVLRLWWSKDSHEIDSSSAAVQRSNVLNPNKAFWGINATVCLVVLTLCRVQVTTILIYLQAVIGG